MGDGRRECNHERANPKIHVSTIGFIEYNCDQRAPVEGQPWEPRKQANSNSRRRFAAREYLKLFLCFVIFVVVTIHRRMRFPIKDLSHLKQGSILSNFTNPRSNNFC